MAISAEYASIFYQWRTASSTGKYNVFGQKTFTPKNMRMNKQNEEVTNWKTKQFWRFGARWNHGAPEPRPLQNFCEELRKEIGVRIVLEVWPYVIPAMGSQDPKVRSKLPPVIWRMPCHGKKVMDWGFTMRPVALDHFRWLFPWNHPEIQLDHSIWPISFLVKPQCSLLNPCVRSLSDPKINLPSLRIPEFCSAPVTYTPNPLLDHHFPHEIS